MLRKSVRRSQQPHGLRPRSTAVCLLRPWVRIPPGARMFVCCECCVLSDRGLCDGLITRPEESYRLWGVVVCDQETSCARRLYTPQRAAKYKPTMGCSACRKEMKFCPVGDEVTERLVCRQTDRQTNITNQTVSFRSANTHQNRS